MHYSDKYRMCAVSDYSAFDSSQRYHLASFERDYMGRINGPKW